MIHQLSLRSRLLIAVGAITLIALTVADVAVYTSLKSYLYTQVDATLQLSHLPVEAALADSSELSDGPSGPPSESGAVSESSEFCQVGRESAPGMFIEVFNSANRAVSGERCPAFFPGKKSYSPSLPGLITGFKRSPSDPHEPVTYFTTESTVKGGPSFRVRASRLSTGGILVLADPVTNVTSTLRQLLLLESLVTSAALVGAMLLGLWLVRVGLRPLRDVVKTADAITAGDLMSRVPNVNTRTEVGHVSDALNIMLERIEQSFADLQESENRLRQFVADASHELRTPIAAISAYTQLFFREFEEHERDLPRVMEGIRRESDRMSHLVEDLLLIARYDEDEGPSFREVEMVGLVAEAVETARTVGPQWPISLVANQPVEVLGDHVALRQVIDNLLANVRAHAPAGTMTTVRVGQDGTNAFVEVADDGPGFEPNQAAALFQRFFRLDASRARSTGGAGLGLAIVATIVRAHRGHVIALSPREGGALFRFTIPKVDETGTVDLDT